MTAEFVAWVMVFAVAAYACAGGTDYGAGFWDLLAGEPNAASGPGGSSTTRWPRSGRSTTSG